MAIYGDEKHNENMEGTFSVNNVDKKYFFVDIPSIDSNGDVDWNNIGKFDTKEEAIKFLQEKFGADEEGRVCFISEISCHPLTFYLQEK